MNWYRENRWLGNFLIVLGVALFVAVWFLFQAKGAFADAMAKFNAAASERSGLEHRTPFPNQENVKKTQLDLESYGKRLNAVKGELSAQVMPATSMAPNEFQAHLRQAILNTAERARSNRVKLPANLNLGFDEFSTSLPGTSDAPLLGQELRQIELLAEILIDAKVDAITSLKREAQKPATVAKGQRVDKPVVERAIVDITFAASPSALRKVLNQIASAEREFFIVRMLYVRNEEQKGPSREQSAAATATTAANALKFIVGNEHIEGTAKIELVKFAF
jgi:hypothetical protein